IELDDALVDLLGALLVGGRLVAASRSEEQALLCLARECVRAPREGTFGRPGKGFGNAGHVTSLLHRALEPEGRPFVIWLLEDCLDASLEVFVVDGDERRGSMVMIERFELRKRSDSVARATARLLAQEREHEPVELLRDPSPRAGVARRSRLLNEVSNRC